VREKEHHIQDALELLTVARLQKMAEDAGLAVTHDSTDKFRAFEDYAKERGLVEADFSSGEYAPYRASLDSHLPTFFDRLALHYKGERFDFLHVEVEYRNAGKKGDFEIRPESSTPTSVSLKNYRKSADRPQYNSQTFNTFALGFVLPKAAGVGKYIDLSTNKTFSSSARKKRDVVLANCGFEHLVPLFKRLDALQAEVRSIFVDTPDWEFYDEDRMDPIRKQYGRQGAEVTMELLDHLPRAAIKSRLLQMAGMDGAEDVLIMDPRVMAESITALSPMRKLFADVREDHCEVDVDLRGQSIFLTLQVEGRPLVSVNHPHTINLNGAWILDDEYRGGKYHAKEKKILEYGQRRPKKSKQISVFVLTWVDLRGAGIFVEE
jgi:hypothetical protein